jgi:Na+/pantothenate symporter
MKTLLLLSGPISAPMQTILSTTLGSSATLVKSPLASIAFLNSADISCLDEGCSG